MVSSVEMRWHVRRQTGGLMSCTDPASHPARVVALRFNTTEFPTIGTAESTNPVLHGNLDVAITARNIASSRESRWYPEVVATEWRTDMRICGLL